jgi:peptidoglycan/xylan/chitin deacetylase (PgdA/CDA1 family)
MYSALSERYPNGVVCIGFDDCYSGQYSLAMNLLSSYGYQATIFPIIDQIGAGGSWTLAQLQQMVNIGWEVAPHASTLANHSGWNGLTPAQIVADVLASQTWIAGQGFGLSGTFAYPLGGFNNGADTAVAPLVKVARTIDSTLYTETLPVGNPLHMRSAAGVGGSGGIGVTTYTTATTGVLALAKAAGALVPITIHDVSSGTSGNINQISIADLTTLVSAINTAGMAVATYGEVLQYAMTGVNTQPIAATNPTIVISGPANAPTIGVGTLAESNITNLVTDLAAKAPLASPSLTGTPVAPTATALTNTTQVATTAYADSAVSVEKTRALAAEATSTTAIANLASGSTNITGPLHVAFSSTTTRSGIKVENTASTSGNSNSALVELKGNSPTAAVDWLFGTDYGENGSNNWFVQDSNNGLRLFVDSTGRLVVGDSTAGPAAANSLDVVGSLKTRGTNSMSPLNICGRSSAYGAPTSGTWQTGDAILDVSGQWYYCTSAGTPGTWTSLQQGGSTVRQNGLAGMNLDIMLATSTTTFTAGVVYCANVYVENPIASVGHIFCRMTTAGGTLTNSYLGIYDVLTGNRLGMSADVSSTFTGVPGVLSIPLASGITGLTWNQELYVAMLVGSAATMPTLAVSAPGSSNINQSSNYRFQKTSTTNNTSIPTSVPTLAASTTGQMPAFALGI